MAQDVEYDERRRGGAHGRVGGACRCSASTRFSSVAFGDDHHPRGGGLLAMRIRVDELGVERELVGTRDIRDEDCLPPYGVSVPVPRGYFHRAASVLRHGLGSGRGRRHDPPVVDLLVTAVGEQWQADRAARDYPHLGSSMRMERRCRIEARLRFCYVHDVAEVRIARVADAVEVGILVARLLVEGAEVQLVRDTVSVPVAVARVADAVTIGVGLIRVRLFEAVVEGIRDAVDIEVLVADLGSGADLPVLGGPDERTQVAQVGEAIAVIVRVAGVAGAVPVGIRLRRVGEQRAVVLVADAVAIEITVALVADAVAIGVELSAVLGGTVHPGAQVARVADAVAIGVGLIRVELERAVVEVVLDAVLVVVVRRVVPVSETSSGDDDRAIVGSPSGLLRRSAEAVGALTILRLDGGDGPEHDAEDAQEPEHIRGPEHEDGLGGGLQGVLPFSRIFAAERLALERKPRT